MNTPKSFQVFVVVAGYSKQVSKTNGSTYIRLEFQSLASKSDSKWKSDTQLDVLRVDVKVFEKVIKSKWVINNPVVLTVEERIKDVTEYLEDEVIKKHTESRIVFVECHQSTFITVNNVDDDISLGARNVEDMKQQIRLTSLYQNSL